MCSWLSAAACISPFEAAGLEAPEFTWARRRPAVMQQDPWAVQFPRFLAVNTAGLQGWGLELQMHGL